jgi:hypothetical protein
MLLWSIAGVILCLPIRIYSHHNVPTMFEVCKLLLMVFRSEVVHFWYVRALIVLFLGAPLSMFVAKRIWLCVLAMVEVLFIPDDSVCANLHILVVVIFFLLGALVAHNKTITRIKLSARWGWIAAVGCLPGLFFLCVFKMYMMKYYFEILLAPLFMIGFLWFEYDVTNAKWPLRKFPDTINVLFCLLYASDSSLICGRRYAFRSWEWADGKACRIFYFVLDLLGRCVGGKSDVEISTVSIRSVGWWHVASKEWPCRTSGRIN